MMIIIIIFFKGLRNSIKGKTCWQIACLTLSWIMWPERNVRIFEKKWRLGEVLWDLFHFYSSLWASCIVAFKGVPLNVIQLCWLSVCDSKV